MLTDNEIADHVRTWIEAGIPEEDDALREAIIALTTNLLRNINDIAAATRGIRDDMP